MAALSAYLDQVYEESYIETGEQAIDEILTAVENLPSLEIEVAALRTACGT